MLLLEPDLEYLAEKLLHNHTSSMPSVVEVTIFFRSCLLSTLSLQSLRTPSSCALSCAILIPRCEVPEAEGSTNHVLFAFNVRFYFDASRASTCDDRHESMALCNFPIV